MCMDEMDYCYIFVVLSISINNIDPFNANYKIVAFFTFY